VAGWPERWGRQKKREPARGHSDAIPSESGSQPGVVVWKGGVAGDGVGAQEKEERWATRRLRVARGGCCKVAGLKGRPGWVGLGTLEPSAQRVRLRAWEICVGESGRVNGAFWDICPEFPPLERPLGKEPRKRAWHRNPNFRFKIGLCSRSLPPIVQAPLRRASGPEGRLRFV
jgi:hypothetical protein